MYFEDSIINVVSWSLFSYKATWFLYTHQKIDLICFKWMSKIIRNKLNFSAYYNFNCVSFIWMFRIDQKVF